MVGHLLGACGLSLRDTVCENHAQELCQCLIRSSGSDGVFLSMGGIVSVGLFGSHS